MANISTVFVSRIPAEVTHDEFLQLFRVFGPCTARLIPSKHDDSYCIGFVDYPECWMAYAAVAELDGWCVLRPGYSALAVQLADPERIESFHKSRLQKRSPWSKSTKSSSSDESQDDNWMEARKRHSPQVASATELVEASSEKGSAPSAVWRLSANSAETQASQQSDRDSPRDSSEKNVSAVAPALPNIAKVYVGNIPRGLTRRELDDLFSTCGKVVDLHLMTGRQHIPVMSALIDYSCIHEAAAAICALDFHEIVPGKEPIRVRFANIKIR